MCVIEIETTDYIDLVRERLFFEFKFLERDGFEVEIEQINQGQTAVFVCQCNSEQQSSIIIFKEYIANAISDVIINYLEENLLIKILRTNYKDLLPYEEEEILELAYERLNFLAEEEGKEIRSKVRRKNQILTEITDYLTVENKIILEGFVDFRLKGYLANLELIIEEAVDDYFIREEYKEFISLLKDLIEDQVTRHKLINIVKIEENNFQLLDKNGRVIENSFLDEYVLSLGDEDLDNNDLLISALISIAPEKIVLHFKEPQVLVDMLKRIFTDRVSVCLGCEEYCTLSSNQEKNF